MAKAEWVNLSQDRGSGDASIAVSSRAPHTGREARTSIITWVAENVEPIERTIVQEGADVTTELVGGNSIATNSVRVLIMGLSNESGLGFRAPDNNILPYSIDTTMTVAGMTITRKDNEMTMIPGDPGAQQMYKFTLGLTIQPEEATLAPIKGSLAIDGASGKSILVRISYSAQEGVYLTVPEGDILLDANGTPVTIEVESNTNWVIE